MQKFAAFKNFKLGSRATIVVCVLCLIVPLFGLALTRMTQYADGYSIAVLKKEKVSLVEEMRALNLEIALLRRPERILSVAAEKLGMVRPRLDQLSRGSN